MLMSFPLHKFALLPEGHTGEVWQPSSHSFSEIGEHWTELYLPYFAEIQDKVLSGLKLLP
jgi:hypothetical protein